MGSTDGDGDDVIVGANVVCCVGDIDVGLLFEVVGVIVGM